MNDSRHVIWTNYNLDFDDWKDDLEEYYPELSEAELYEKMYEVNNDYLDDERANLNIRLARPILVIADIGRWNGRFSGYAVIQSGNIRDCLYTDMDYATWYVDTKGDLRCDAVHHDGTNYYLYREIKSDVSDEKIERLKNKIEFGEATRKDIEAVTERLGDRIGKVYGWEFPSEKKEKEAER